MQSHRTHQPIRGSIAAIALTGILCASAHAQFGPATVVVAEVIERDVAPVQTFVASVTPLRKSIVGTAVNGRVVEFLPHTALAYGMPVRTADGASGYRLRLAHLADVVAMGQSEEEALAAMQQTLQQRVDDAKQTGNAIDWAKEAYQREEGEQDHWIVYRPDESKLIQVRQGQPLAMLRTGTIEIKIQAAVAQRDLRRAEHTEAEAIQDGLVAEAVARVQAAESMRQYTVGQHSRNEQLYQQNRSVSLQQLQQSEADAATAQRELIQAQTAELHVKRRDRIIQAKARLDEAEAVLTELRDRLEKYVIRAPFDGFVVGEHTEVGAWIREGEPVADVVQLNPVEVRAFVSDQYVSNLQIGSKAIVRPNVPLPAGKTPPVGRITGVIAEAVTRSRTFPVRIQVDNADYFLKAGMLAEVEMEVGPQRSSVLVPKDALYIDRRYPVPQIFLAVPDEKDPKKFKPVQMAVKQGASLGSWISVVPVDGTIEAGDLVIEKGNERITPATKELVLNTQGATPPPK